MKVSNVKLNRDISLYWESDKGFGNFIFYMADGKIKCDNEAMTRDSVRDVLLHLADTCELLDGEEPWYKCEDCGKRMPEKHRLLICINTQEDGTERYNYKCCYCRGEIFKDD